MPYVKVQITAEPINTPENKAEIIRRITETLQTVLGKDPETTFVVIEEVPLENWGVGGVPAPVWRRQRAAQKDK